MKKILILLAISLNSLVAYSSSAVYQDEDTGQHYQIKNAASGEEANEQALEYCERKSKNGNCKLIYKTDYGGYGAIAIGNRSNGYIYGASSQTLADKVAIRNCGINSKISTCHITSRWHDKGKIVTIREPSNEVCGTNVATGLPILCSTGLDVQGNANGYRGGMSTNQIMQQNRY